MPLRDVAGLDRGVRENCVAVLAYIFLRYTAEVALDVAGECRVNGMYWAFLLWFLRREEVSNVAIQSLQENELSSDEPKILESLEKRNWPSGRLEAVRAEGQKGGSGFDVRLHAIAWISELSREKKERSWCSTPRRRER
jgi:hypothetical protein